MNKILWSITTPVTGIIRGPEFKILARRECEICFSLEAQDGSEQWLALRFSGVQAFKCTYLQALGCISRTLRTEAYGKVISVAQSEWLETLQQAVNEYGSKIPSKLGGIQHLMICFDDGPCYEILCNEFSVRQP